MLPSIDDACGAHFRYRDFIECGATWGQTKPDNRPLQRETYAAMAALCICVLDPIWERFGPIELTYGFVSPALDKLIRLHPKPNTTRSSDQHAGCELNGNGNLYCKRRGQGFDLLVRSTGSREVAEWVIANTMFDRLYFYADDRPFHVSHGPEQARFRTFSKKIG